MSGAWKLAYADFTTSMMALFMLLWLIASRNTDVNKNVAVLYDKEIPIFSREVSAKTVQTMNIGEISSSAQTQAQVVKEKYNRLILDLRSAFLGDENVRIGINTNAVSISIVSFDKEPMFKTGETTMYSVLKNILYRLSLHLRDFKGHIAIGGHTNSLEYPEGSKYNNWNLSADRAIAAKDFLIDDCGVSKDKFFAVIGYEGSVGYDKDFTSNAANKRITLTLFADGQVDFFTSDAITPGGKMY